MTTSDERVEELAKRLIDEFLRDNPTYATFMGVHEYDGQLGDLSPAAIERTIHQLNQALEDLAQIDPSGHSEEGMINREMFEAGIEYQLFQFEELKTYESDVDFGGFIGMALFPLFTRDFAPFEERMMAIASRLEGIPLAFDQFKRTITKPVHLWTQTALQSLQGIPGLIQLIISVAEQKLQGEALVRLQNAGEIAIDTLAEVQAWLEELAQDHRDFWCIGAYNFEKLIRVRRLGLTPAEILRIGFKYLKQFEGELKELAGKISPGSSVDQVREMIKDNHPKTFEDTLAYYQQWVEKAKQWVIANDFVTVREGILDVIETPAFLAPLLPTAALVPPGFFESSKRGEYIVTRPADEKNLREHYYARIPNTCIHEAYPGHFNEGLASAEAPLSRLLLEGSEMVEGWAFYCEQVSIDMGFNDTPEARFAQTNALLFRAARIIVDVNLSSGRMGFNEAVKFLTIKTGMAEASAIAEVTRYTQTPGYPLSYLLGRHQIMDARNELENEFGEQFNQKLFHDVIVSSGRVPISYIPRLYRIASKRKV
ncbi:MAG: DUF885 domain-containing protein [Candidatus Thorarchaeota archaeon]